MASNFGDVKTAGRSPFTFGKVAGKKASDGSIVTRPKWFLIDSGAQISTIDPSNFANLRVQTGTKFVKSKKGAAGTSATGAKLRSAFGVSIQVQVIDANGAPEIRVCNTTMAIADVPYAIYGVDQLANTNSRLPSPVDAHGKYSPGGDVFEGGLQDDGFAADTGFNWKL